MFDKDGYPTEEYLEKIENFLGDDHDLLEMVREAWHYPERAKVIDNVYVFSTGGWSGNEVLIEALLKNRKWHTLYWQSVQLVGGFYAIAIDEIGKSKAQRIIDKMVHSFWTKTK